MNQKFSVSAAALAALSLSSIATAGFTSAVTPVFRGGPCSRFAGFEQFSSAYNGQNLADVAGTTDATATIVQTVQGAILTGSGNIYHMSAPTQFVLDDSGADDVQQVVLQTSTLGNSRSLASFVLYYLDAQAQEIALSPTEFVPLVQLPLQHDELYFRWDLSSIPELVTSFRIEWSASAANMSFDAALLDVLTQCAPGTPVCVGDGTGTACPCGNNGTLTNGCANSVSSNGGRLSSLGIPSLSADSFVLTGVNMPNAPGLFLQGSVAQSFGLGFWFGDGILCTGGTITRLGVSFPVQGLSTFPASGGANLSTLSQVTSAGTSAVYQVWYRDAASFCSSATFNLTNGYQVLWAP